MSPEPAQLMTDIIGRVQVIEHTTMRILSGSKFFGMFPSLRLPSFIHAELGMLRLVSWLYAMYVELGKPSIDFIVDRFEGYDLDKDGAQKDHIEHVILLRTLFQHNLDPTSQSDIKTQEQCELWFRVNSGNSYPETDQEWQKSLIALMSASKQFLYSVHRCIQCVEEDESREEILRQWAFRKDHYHPQHTFDRIIEIVAADIGRDGIKPRTFSNRYYAKWRKELELREDTYDFETEARRLVERDLLEDTSPQMPIDGRDIMREFSIEPGRQVGELLKMAMGLFDASPCSSKELINRLRKKVEENA